MALPNPKRKRRYNFKRQFRRKLKKIAFMILIAAIFGGTRYYGKFYDNDLIKKKLNERGFTNKQAIKKQKEQQAD